MEDIVISRIGASSPKYPEVWALREEVLRRPLGLSLRDEDLSRDQTDTILIAEQKDRVIACLMLQRKDGKRVQLRQMAVNAGWQGKGVGRRLVRAAEALAKQEGFEKIILHARKVAAGFYEGLGYTVSGDEFTEVGIPHYFMERELQGEKT